MTPEEHGRVKALFARLVDRDADARRAALDAEPSAVRTAVEALLAEDEAPNPALEAHLEGGGAALLARAIDDEPVPERIGPYEIVRLLGEGGMGTVYEATQANPRRRVALKLVRSGRATAQTVRRFRREAALLGRLQHPGIAHIYEAGKAEVHGAVRPYLAMEFVEGPTLDRHVRERGLSRPQILELVARVADAVQHAHQKGIVHRDLKPANILVIDADDGGATTHGGAGSRVVDAVGRPKILDFGVSRVVDDDDPTHSLETSAGQLLGTLAYMAPEQVRGAPADVDTRCDVFALGAILFELLAGRLPIAVHGLPLPDAIRAIAEQEPPRLGAIDRSLRGDVETIVARALEKDVERRYRSAAELAEDLRRHLRDEPILARPATPLYQLRKFARRNGQLVAGAAAALTALVGGLVAVTILLGRVADERDQARLARQRQDEVARFQAEVLQGIDVAPMAARIVADVREQVGSRLASAGDVDAALAGLDATNIARDAFAVNIVERAVERLDAGYTDDRVVEATLRSMVADMFGSLYLFERQLAQNEIALARRRSALGEDDADTIDSLARCASSAAWAQRRAEARRWCDEALAAARRVHGEDGADTIRLEIQSAGLIAESDPQEAMRVLQRVMERRRRGALADEDVLAAEVQLAALYSSMQRIDEAVSMYEDILARARTEDGELPIEVLGTAQGLAGEYQRRGEVAKAEALLREVIAGWRRRYGDDHEATIFPRMMLGGILMNGDRLAEAEVELRLAATSAARVLDPRRSHRSTAVRRHAECLRRLDRPAEAEVILRRELSVRRAAIGAPDRIDAELLLELGRALHAEGRDEEAVATLRQVGDVLGLDPAATDEWIRTAFD